MAPTPTTPPEEEAPSPHALLMSRSDDRVVRCVCGWPGKYPTGELRWTTRRACNAHVRFSGPRKARA